MREAGAIQNALGDRVGDDRAGPPGGDVADRLADRGKRSMRTALIRPAGPRGRSMAGGHHRQRLGERAGRGFGADVCELNLEAESLGPPIEQVAISKQVEWREL